MRSTLGHQQSSQAILYVQDYHLLWCIFPNDFHLIAKEVTEPTPHLLYITTKDSVCSELPSVDPINSITIVFFSSRYYDASFPWVPIPIFRQE